MIDDLLLERVRASYVRARDELLAERNQRGHWTGELSASALSTATALMALEMVARATNRTARSSRSADDLAPLIGGGLAWLAAQQNDDGGWGDTTRSFSNISTTMLCHAVFHATQERWDDSSTRAAQSSRGAHATAVERAHAYIRNAGGVPAVVARYGKDKTFSVPILTHCAVAGLVDWEDVTQLPFELACVPARFYKTVRLPVVSYALPALIAIGQVRHHFRPTRIPGLRWLRNRAKRTSLKILERIQPSNGGFLEATPLTSFVTMSLAGMGLVDHPVVRRGVEFIVDSVREDGSWPIDTNLATWVTTLSVNALGPGLPDEAREPILRWLLDQQFKTVHPFTNADPGGWSWTDLPGAVPDADDTAGAILAILELIGEQASALSPQPTGGWGRADRRAPRQQDDNTLGATVGRPQPPLTDDLVAEAHEAVRLGIRWLLHLQNRDGGWPTFCRGWGTLPFDRSSPDITAHCIRALRGYLQMWLNEHRNRWRSLQSEDPFPFDLRDVQRVDFHPFQPLNRKIHKALAFLDQQQLPGGAWQPLWFGNQHAIEERNTTYGTSKVLVTVTTESPAGVDSAECARAHLVDVQNSDGGWGGDIGCPSSVEETALAVEVLLSDPVEASQLAARQGVLWLIRRVEDGTYREPTPIGFYFAKLWYFERLYPQIFTVAALRRACAVLADEKSP